MHHLLISQERRYKTIKVILKYFMKKIEKGGKAMKKIILALFLILIPTVGIAENDIGEYNGNTWRSWTGQIKPNYIVGFIAGSNYVIQNSLPISKYILENKNDPIEVRELFLTRYSITNITSGQIVDGLNMFYEDFRNRNILLMDAIYVIKKQIKGSTPEDIERILLYLRSDKKEDKHLRIKDEKGKIIKIISFP